MIKTRHDAEIQVVGKGPFVMALDTDQLELLGALLGMVKLGPATYAKAAYGLINNLEELTDDSEYTTFALGQVLPILEVHDGETYDIIATYDDDHIIEFVV